MGFAWLSIKGAGVFAGVVAVISTVVGALETVLVDAPWPVVMTVVVAAWRLAGPRVAMFTAAGLAYLALFGLWEISMVTVACSVPPHSCAYCWDPARDLLRQEHQGLQRRPAGARSYADDAV